ncbi:MAG: ABC transporter substrate-binding protein/permease [Coriobacteriales bacterium]|jgi:polar amino acid transport system substrate-binding protein|nr:ABC transporter substrate-binding protein/permease [Coriobacteriales bacterium]
MRGKVLRRIVFIATLVVLVALLALAPPLAGFAAEKSDPSTSTSTESAPDTAATSAPATAAASAAAATSASATATASGKTQISSIEDMAHARVGMIEGTIFDAMVKERFPEAERVYLNTSSDIIAALQSGKIDCFLQNEVSVKEMQKTVPGLSYLEEPFSIEHYGMIFPQGTTGLPEEFNEQIAQLWDDGTIEALRVKWMDGPDEGKVMDEIVLDGTKGPLRMATDDAKLPFSYRDTDGYTGYDIELVSIIAKRLGYQLEISGMTFGGIIPAISSGKYDFASAGIAYTDERAEAVLFSDPIYYGNTVCALYSEPTGSSGLWQGLVTGFTSTFVTEDRWRLIVDGLAVTLQITALSVLFGTALGFALYFMARSRLRIARVFVAVLSRVMDGLPEVVILLVSAYIIFRSLAIPSVWVVTIAFSVLFAVGVAQTLKVGVNSVEAGQVEAAQALGFEGRSVFALIVFPQAARSVLAVYVGQVIKLLKATAIVGYIAVDDLTRASDIIRSRTFDAFFPLLSTAAVYFILSALLVLLLRIVQKRLDPRRRKRTIKGVVLSVPGASGAFAAPLVPSAPTSGKLAPTASAAPTIPTARGPHDEG